MAKDARLQNADESLRRHGGFLYAAVGLWGAWFLVLVYLAWTK
jgi:hypothetical protein